MRALLVLFFCCVLNAADHPDFSGSWLLNLSASTYEAGSVAPDKQARTIHLKANRLKYKLEGERNGRKGGFDLELEIGGTPYESDAAGVVSAEWRGDALFISTLYNPGSERSTSQVETWTLASDGKRLTDDLVYTRHNGTEIHIHQVFDKQETK